MERRRAPPLMPCHTASCCTTQMPSHNAKPMQFKAHPYQERCCCSVFGLVAAYFLPCPLMSLPIRTSAVFILVEAALPAVHLLSIFHSSLHMHWCSEAWDKAGSLTSKLSFFVVPTSAVVNSHLGKRQYETTFW